MAKARSPYGASTPSFRARVLIFVLLMNFNTFSYFFFRKKDKNRNTIVRLFHLLFVVLTLLLVAGCWAILTKDVSARKFRGLGGELGELAIFFYILSAIPGIFRRFGISHSLLRIVMMFRRYTGIASFLFVLLHASFEFIAPIASGMKSLFPLEPFTIFGTIAGIFLFMLAVTSNDWSVARLGDWWGKIQNLTYVLVWFIALHVVLIEINVWSLAIILTATAQIGSHLYSRRT